MSRYDEYKEKAEQAAKDGDKDTEKMYRKRMKNIEKCKKWHQKRREAAA
ncbi:MAG: hypothetical protein MPK62_00605 [Alphaproteobacteria bacterium]|nr:hypothetical protein [Alphaproteobacteria bacterium]MDA8029638.1 hypothetical protein [Alphaproteobacteria bacterium]